MQGFVNQLIDCIKLIVDESRLEARWTTWLQPEEAIWIGSSFRIRDLKNHNMTYAMEVAPQRCEVTATVKTLLESLFSLKTTVASKQGFMTPSVSLSSQSNACLL